MEVAPSPYAYHSFPIFLIVSLLSPGDNIGIWKSGKQTNKQSPQFLIFLCYDLDTRHLSFINMVKYQPQSSQEPLSSNVGRRVLSLTPPRVQLKQALAESTDIFDESVSDRQGGKLPLGTKGQHAVRV